MEELDIKNYKNRHSFGSKIARWVWNLVCVLLYKWTPNHSGLFNAWRIFLLRCFGAKIGKYCVVKSSCEVWQPWNLMMGDYVALDEHVVCYTVDRIVIGSQTTVSREAFLCCASHDVSSRIMELVVAPVTIGANAWIASRVIILPGCKVGDGAVVAAGAIVTKDIDAWTVVGGNPARFISRRELKNA